MTMVDTVPVGTSVTTTAIVTRRILKAPCSLVWDAWTKPEHIAQWLGPFDFTVTNHMHDLRVGGMWEFIMHGPDGTDYKNVVKFTKIIPNELLEYDHISGPNFHATITFSDLGETTDLTMRMEFESSEELDRAEQVFGATEGQKQTISRLDAFLGAQ